MHENREVSHVPASAGRSGKANSHNPGTHAGEESDCAIVPLKQPNKGAQAPAEVVEGRARTKENDAESGTSPTRSGERVSQGLGGVRQAARERKQERFTALLHHLTVELLRESDYAQFR
jgi:RNA-directed DNA polymerase